MTIIREHETVSAETWRDLAACKHHGSLFFPAEGDTHRFDPAPAKRICSSCPVRSECLDWALRTEEPCGVWGGLDENERRVSLNQRDKTSPAPSLSTALRSGSGVYDLVYDDDGWMTFGPVG